MPLYEYSCTSCGHAFEETKKIAEREVPTTEPCKECGEMTVVKGIFSAPKVSYTNTGSLKTTDSFNDRLKEIKNKLPERFKGNINSVIR